MKMLYVALLTNKQRRKKQHTGRIVYNAEYYVKKNWQMWKFWIIPYIKIEAFIKGK